MWARAPQFRHKTHQTHHVFHRVIINCSFVTTSVSFLIHCISSYVAYILMLYKQVQYECLWSNKVLYTGKSYSTQVSWFFIHYWKSVTSNTFQFRDDSESKSAINKTCCGHRLHWFKKTVQKDQDRSVVF